MYVVLNGSTSETVELSIAGLPDGTTVDNNKYEWTFSDGAENYLDYSIYNGSENGRGNTIWLTGKKNGATANITANGTGLNKTTLTVRHEKAAYPLNIVLVSYDDSTDLEGLTTLYATQTSYTLYTEDKLNIFVTPVFYSASQSDTVDTGTDASVSWSVTKGLNEVIGFTQYGYSANVTGISAGVAEISAWLTDNPSEKVTFYINVKQGGKIEDDKPCYLTTSYNVVTTSVGNTENINVIPVNIDGLKYDKTIWKNNNPELFSVTSNGADATITALREGSGTIEISHPLSNNTLTLTVHVGSEYVYSNTDVCYIKPKKAGQGILTVHHTEAEYDKEVLVIIQKSAAELADIPYISTSQNVATVIQGEYATLSVALKNAESYEASNWSWTSSNGNISDVVVNSGSTAILSGVNPGTTKITVSHTDCLYPLEIIVLCLDASSVSANPFIHTSSNIVTLTKGGTATVTADMTGGTANDDASFVWTVADSSVALISTGSGSCYIKGLKAGQTYITVRNTNYPDAYSKTVFVRVEDTTDKDCYITVTSKVLKMNPANTSGETITATLENGAVLDAQDFVWWADDYNIVSLSSITDTCQIVPTGVSGTTYVHVKHPKVVTTVDILVMCSEYTEFAFKYASKEILEKSILFIPMEVPITSEESWIEYSSSDNNVVVATGSNQVCMLAGIIKGSATINATLKTANGIIGTSQMAVIVNKADTTINTISMNQTIINLEIGESKTLDALLSGNDISTNDYYNLEWSLTIAAARKAEPIMHAKVTK